jgi:hypothetical protein
MILSNEQVDVELDRFRPPDVPALTDSAKLVVDRLKKRYPDITPQTAANSLRAAADVLDSLQDFEALLTLADELDPPTT